MAQACALCEALGSRAHVGIACDVYHTWWDPAARGRSPARRRQASSSASTSATGGPRPYDLLNDRGLMGEGCIDLHQIGSWVRSAGFGGYDEVEIFSDRHWSTDQDGYLGRIIAAYQKLPSDDRPVAPRHAFF